MAHLYLNSTLPKQLAGVHDLTTYISIVVKKQVKRTAHVTTTTADPAQLLLQTLTQAMHASSVNDATVDTYAIESDTLVPWLLHHHIPERLVSVDSHIQICRKSADIIAYLAQHGEMNTTWLDLIWQRMEREPHESVITSVYETIMCIFLHLTLQHRAYLYATKVTHITCASFDVTFMMKLLIPFIFQCLFAKTTEEMKRVKEAETETHVETEQDAGNGVKSTPDGAIADMSIDDDPNVQQLRADDYGLP